MSANANFLRQIDILSPSDMLYPITIIGVGGIGSPTALGLAKLGFGAMTLYDPGRVETHNRPNQLFRKQDELDEEDEECRGRFKVAAMKEIIGEFAEWCEVNAMAEQFEGQHALEGIVISAVDHMEVDEETKAWGRKEIWQRVRYNVNVPLFIDGRLGGETVQVYTVRPCRLEDVEYYEETLFLDEEAIPLPCTEQSIIYSGFAIAAIIAQRVKKWLKNEPHSLALTYHLGSDRLLLD